MIQVLVRQVLLKGHKSSVEPGPRQAVLLSGMPFENLSWRRLAERSINQSITCTVLGDQQGANRLSMTRKASVVSDAVHINVRNSCGAAVT